MKKKVLICDDDLEILEVCNLILTKKDFEVHILENCEEIFTLLKDFKPDVILIDLWFPEMGGEAATLKLKNDPDTQHLPVILFSAHNELESICRKINADGFIKKPFTIPTLLNSINDAINRIEVSH